MHLARVTHSQVRLCRGGGGGGVRGGNTYLSCEQGGPVVLLLGPKRRKPQPSALPAHCMFVGDVSGLPPGGTLLVAEGCRGGP